MATKEELDSRLGILGQGLIDNAFSGFAAVIPGMVQKTIESLGEALQGNATAAWDSTINEWIDKNFCDADTGAMLRNLRDETFPGGLITTMFIRIRMLTTLISSAADIMKLDRQYDLQSRTTPHPAPVDNLVRSMIIDPGRSNENRDQLKRHGYSDQQIDNIILSYYAKVPEGAIRTNYLRGNINSDTMYERMREIGYTDTRIQEIVQTWTLYPGPQDLFSMVAHEAFEPGIYQALGLDEEFPEAQVPWLQAQGISREWAEKYWIAHWEQPSIGQGFEMLHRGVIDRSELDMLFRVVEIPRFWREKLMAITYNPYTRVDTRRMHDMGVLSTEEMVHAYQDQGYDADKAVKMAEFTIKYNAENDKQITRSLILTSYRDGLITRGAAMALLIEAEYSQDLADYYLTHEEYKRDLEVQKMHIDILEEKYQLNLISESELRSGLNSLGLLASKTDAIVEKLTLQTYKKEALPSRTDIDDLLIQGIINEGDWRYIMTRRGYTSEHQGWFLSLIDKYINVSQNLPTKAEVKTWFKKGLIDQAQYRVEMRQLGYAEHYIDLYIQSMSDETTT